MGNGYLGDGDKQSLTKEDFNDPKNKNTDIINGKRNTFELMNTNFTMGDLDNPKNAYLTVYKNKLDGRPCKSPVRSQKKKYGVNFNISNHKENDFLSEKQLR